MLSDKMEFSITLWNIWSVLPFPGKTTTTVCSVGKHFTLRFPRVAGRNRRQELRAHNVAIPHTVHRGRVPAGPCPAAPHASAPPGSQGFLQCWTSSHQDMEKIHHILQWNRPRHEEDPRIYPCPPADFSSHPKTSLRSKSRWKCPSLKQIRLEVQLRTSLGREYR